MMRFVAYSLLFAYFFLNALSGFAQAPTNDNCPGILLTSASAATCSSSSTYSLTNATATPGSTAQSCGGTATSKDVWFAFQALGGRTTVSFSGLGKTSGLGKANDLIVELYYASNSSCASKTYIACQKNTANNTSVNFSFQTEYTQGQYYLRVFSATSITGTASNFGLCIRHEKLPTNDDCTNAAVLNAGAIVNGTIWSATQSLNIPAGCATGTPDDDVWYKFTAQKSSATIKLTNIGTDFNTAGPRMQIFTGTCGTLLSTYCGNSVLDVNDLSIGAEYLVRVYSSNAGLVGTAASAASGSAFSIQLTNAPEVTAGASNEVFQQSVLSGVSLLNDPWEVTYGPDNYLWVTEAKGYKVQRINPKTGAKTEVLNISNKSTFLLPGDTTFNVQFPASQNPWPQGGFAGLAIHPKFKDSVAPKNFVYVSYVYKYLGEPVAGAGSFFVNRIVRFEFDTVALRLKNPVSLRDTLPGRSDHNSQRMIIAPVDGKDYLFYAAGDMGAGQFANKTRPIRAQLKDFYEGKILRFNLEPDGEAGVYDKWLPNDNPFNTPKQSAVWAIGIRNNQGFAYANGKLYGSSHGPFSDDEINIIEKAKNYGHPLVIGYAADNNYNGSRAGAADGSLPLISNEAANAVAITNYKDPLFSAYPSTQPMINSIYNNQVNNGAWPSEGWSGLDIYTNKVIPAWKNSLIVSSLKWGRVIRLKLDDAGTQVMPSGASDTITYFGSTNRYRDIAWDPNGKDLYVIMDKSATTSGPSALNPAVPACAGCLVKYTFLGYKDAASGRSSIPGWTPVTTGSNNTCVAGTSVTIDQSNSHYWVPVTGPDGNILAEIKANGNNLGAITTSFYSNGNAVRENNFKKLYLDRNITITPRNQPNTPVDIRLYITKAEFNRLQAAKNSHGLSSGVNTITDLVIYKNSDACSGVITNTLEPVNMNYEEAFGADGYVLSGTISGFSTFYFGSGELATLPLKFVDFNAAWQQQNATMKWITANEDNIGQFDIERSTDGTHYTKIGSKEALNEATSNTYQFADVNAAMLEGKVVYYRLKVIEKDGKQYYSKTVYLPLSADNKLLLYPNPAESILTIRLAAKQPQQLMIKVTDINGRKVFEKQQVFSQNNNELKLDVRKWASQLYFVNITNAAGEVIAVEKFRRL